MLITFSVLAGAAAGPSTITLAASNDPGLPTSTIAVNTGLSFSNANIPETLRPAPANPPTFVNNVDGSVNIASNPNAAASFTITGTSTTVAAGGSTPFTVTAINGVGATATGYTGTVNFTSSDGQAGLPSSYTFQTSDNGVHVFSATLKTAGSQTLTATDSSSSSVNGTSNPITVTPLSASHFSFSVPANATAGTPFNFSVTALDSFNNIATSYSGSVKFTTSDTLATPPVNETLSSGVGGPYTATLKKAGNQTLIATDSSNSGLNGTSGPISVAPTSATSFAVAGSPTSVAAGTSVSFTVTALDTYGNVATGYTGTVGFTTNDPLATPPANQTLTNGVGAPVSVALKTAGTNQELIATDTQFITIKGTSNLITVTPLSATQLVVTASPAPVQAGTAVIFTVTAEDTYGNTATGYTGTVHFTSTDTVTTLPSNSTLTNGTKQFSVTLKKAGNQTLTATDAPDSLTGISGAISVSPASTSSFAINGSPTSITAGGNVTFSVIAQDNFGNATPGYTGTVGFSISNNAGTPPSAQTLTGGAGSFNVVLTKSGNQTLTATDVINSAINGTSNVISVAAAAPTHFAVVAPSPETAGIAFNFTVTALDTFNNIATGYSGTVNFSFANNNSTPPSNATLSSGTGIFAATLKVVGTNALIATDTVTPSIIGTSNAISVNPGAAAKFTVSGPTPATAGLAFNLTVTATDSFGNTATGYTGTVHFTTTDTLATPPTDATLVNGTNTFSVTLKSAGNQTLTATDKSNTSITGSAVFSVAAGAATHFSVSGTPSTVTAGSNVTFSVTALDSFGNTATGYTGTVHYTTTDTLATPPGNGPLSGGTGSFSLTLKTAGTQTLTAADVNTGISGISNMISVNPSAATQFTVVGPATAVAGLATTFSVTALDTYSNVATGYTGSVRITASDGQAVLPPNNTLTNGKGTFTVTLKTAGPQEVTATDTAHSGINGTSTPITVSPSTAASFVLSGVPGSATIGTVVNFTVTAQDSFGNTATGYTGTVKITSSDGAASLPPNSTLPGGLGHLRGDVPHGGHHDVDRDRYLQRRPHRQRHAFRDHGAPGNPLHRHRAVDVHRGRAVDIHGNRTIGEQRHRDRLYRHRAFHHIRCQRRVAP